MSRVGAEVETAKRVEQQLVLLGGVARHVCAQTCAAKSTYVYVRARLQLLS